MKRLYPLIIGFALIMAMPNLANAQGSLDLTISPPVSYLHVKPGSKQAHTIHIQNNGDHTITVTPTVHNFSVQPDTGLPQLADDHTFPHFTSLDQQLVPMLLEPDQKAQLTLAIAPPQNALEKEYPLSIVFVAEEDDATTPSRLKGSVASNLILLISSKNEFTQRLTVAEINAPLLLDSFQSLSIHPLLKNEGLATSTASGSAVIKNWMGTEVARFELFPDNILGFSQRPARARDLEKPNSLQPIPFDYKPTLLLGPYTVEVTLNNQEELTTNKKTVVALPFLALIALFAGGTISFWHWKQEKTKNPFE